MFPNNKGRAGLVGLGVLALMLTACAGNGAEAEGPNEAATGGSAGTCDVVEGFPSGPIEIIVGYPAGGGTDSVGRLLADGLSEGLDTPVNVVNRDGGAGVVGAEAMASAEPDGHTLGILGTDVILSHWTDRSDRSLEDFTAIAQVNQDGAGLLVSADSEWETAEELMSAIKENPGELRASGTAQGGVWHIGLIDMLLSSGLQADDVTWVPSDGAAPAGQQLVAGGVDFTTNSLGESISLLDGGSVRALAVNGDERAVEFPDVPTFEEATGNPANAGVRRGLGGPAGMDDAIVDVLACHTENIVNSDEFIESMENLGLGLNYLNATDFTEGLSADDERVGELLNEAGLLP